MPFSGLCVALVRGRRGDGSSRCALPVLDGGVVTGEVLETIDPYSVESIAVLMPVEATTLYGPLGAGGAVLVFTRRGR